MQKDMQHTWSNGQKMTIKKNFIRNGCSPEGKPDWMCGSYSMNLPKLNWEMGKQELDSLWNKKQKHAWISNPGNRTLTHSKLHWYKQNAVLTFLSGWNRLQEGMLEKLLCKCEELDVRDWDISELRMFKKAEAYQSWSDLFGFSEAASLAGVSVLKTSPLGSWGIYNPALLFTINKQKTANIKKNADEHIR